MPITFYLNGNQLTVPPDGDRSILALASDIGWHIEAKCGGRGSCKRCSVMLGPGSYRVFDKVLTLSAEERRDVLSCQTYVLSDQAEIYLPQSSMIALEGARIVDEMSIPPHIHAPQFSSGFGVAVDIGTTTVVAALINLSSGAVIDRASLYNQQIIKADDVVSRISLCSADGQLEELQRLVIADTLNPLLHTLCSNAAISTHEIIHVAVSGNTVMMHIFFGLSPVSIGTLPFKPLSRTFSSTAAALQIDVAPDVPINAMPAISGYIGGDITSDLHVFSQGNNGNTTTTDLALSVLVDIGTNGEIVACRDNVMTACATAAGPAFEGAGILYGMRAAAGAIESIQYDETLDFKLRVIGTQKPRGICGSAIIDFVAEGFRCGLINFIGRYDVDRLRQQNRYISVLGMHACCLVPAEETATGEALVVTEGDIAEVLKAKAAIYGGLKSLLQELGQTPRQIDRLILSGGFARHINLTNAIWLGLLPDIELEKYEVIGNGSLAGASLLLLDQTTLKTCYQLIDKPQVIVLNQTDHFTGYYEEALAIPNLEEDEFPRVVAPDEI